MKSRSPTASDPSELLAAYADGGLDDEERALVERFLAENPDQADEVAGLGDAIAVLRELAPQPRVEPDWSQLSRDIRGACDEVAASKESSKQGRIGGWLASLLRPRYAIGLAACAAAAIILFLVLGGGPGKTTPPGSEGGAAPVEVVISGSERDPDVDLDLDDLDVDGVDGEGPAGNLDDLDENGLDDLDRNLVVELASDSSDDEGDDSVSPVLSAELAAEWAELDASPEAQAGGGDVVFFDEPDYESWLDDLSEAELDALDAYLAKEQAG